MKPGIKFDKNFWSGLPLDMSCFPINKNSYSFCHVLQRLIYHKSSFMIQVHMILVICFYTSYVGYYNEKVLSYRDLKNLFIKFLFHNLRMIKLREMKYN